MGLVRNGSYLQAPEDVSYEKYRFILFSSRKQKHNYWQKLPGGGLALNEKTPPVGSRAVEQKTGSRHVH